MRHAIIKDGKVVDVVMAGEDFAAPDGCTLVRTDTGNVGESYDGRAFVPPAPAKSELFTHLLARYREQVYTFLKIGKLTLSIEEIDYDTIARLAARAAHDPNFSIDWADPRHQVADTVHLNAKQIIALNEAITELQIARAKTRAALIAGIASGKITGHGQIDRPPDPIPAWPQRFDQKPK